MSRPSATPAEGHKHGECFDGGYLQVSDIHRIHYEQYGQLEGKPVVYLHGGPGGRTSITDTIFFDPNVYRVILFDQRGSGKSLPVAELRENTSQDLVSDIEALREHLRIPKWHMVFGGSWGSTLALLYAQTHPNMVGSLVIRGIFTMRRSELLWTRGFHGAAYIFPEAFMTLSITCPLRREMSRIQSTINGSLLMILILVLVPRGHGISGS